MKYIIAVDEKKTWIQNGITFSYAIINESRDMANRQWKTVKGSAYFESVRASAAENLRKFNLTFYAKDQDSAPVFVTIEANTDMYRLVQQAYGFNFMDHHTIVLPDISLDKMEFEVLGSVDCKKYVDDDNDYMNIEIVREKTFGLKFYMSYTNVRYDEILTGREDVCEIKLHPYCSDFNLVKDVVLEEDDYDM